MSTVSDMVEPPGYHHNSKVDGDNHRWIACLPAKRTVEKGGLHKLETAEAVFVLMSARRQKLQRAFSSAWFMDSPTDWEFCRANMTIALHHFTVPYKHDFHHFLFRSSKVKGCLSSHQAGLTHSAAFSVCVPPPLCQQWAPKLV